MIKTMYTRSLYEARNAIVETDVFGLSE